MPLSNASGNKEQKSLGDEVPITRGESDARGQMERFVAACELVLLFHGASPWDSVKRAEWDARINLVLGAPETRDGRVVGAYGDGCWDRAKPTNEATTKNLCNAVRAALNAK